MESLILKTMVNLEIYLNLICSRILFIVFSFFHFLKWITTHNKREWTSRAISLFAILRGEVDWGLGGGETVPYSWTGLGACSPLATLFTSLALILSWGSTMEAVDMATNSVPTYWLMFLFLLDYMFIATSFRSFFCFNSGVHIWLAFWLVQPWNQHT